MKHAADNEDSLEITLTFPANIVSTQDFDNPPFLFFDFIAPYIKMALESFLENGNQLFTS